MTNCNVAILAGGMGTRLHSRTGDLPKPLAPINGKPVLQYQVELCAAHGFRRIALLVHYQSEAIREHFGDGSSWGVEITYVVEKEARGTAGALRDALHIMEERFLVLYADTFADVDLAKLWAFASQGDSAGTLLLHPNDHPNDSDLVEVSDDGFVLGIRPYPHPEGHVYPNLVNAALYVLRKQPVAELVPAQGKHDLAKHTFGAILACGLRLRAYLTPEYIKDMGTPARLEKVERDLLVGLPERLSSRQPRTAVFLDRDGTLNEEVDHLADQRQLRLLPGAAAAVRRLNRAGVLAVCVTNQPVLARGQVGWDGMRAIHARLDQLLGEEHAYLDRLYLCPHHPDTGFTGEVPELKIACGCRKPEPGLIDRAVRELEIDRRRSWLIGDATTDILAGRRAGLGTVLVRTGYAGGDEKHAIVPDYTCDDVSGAVDWILSGRPRALRVLAPVALSARDDRIMLVGGPARAGKSVASQVLRELLRAMGREAHIVPLDAWLQPPAARSEGAGVLARYCMDAAESAISTVVRATGWAMLSVPRWDRKTRSKRAAGAISVGPRDVLIVEGVPALLSSSLRELAGCRIHVDTPDHIRYERLEREYLWRGVGGRERAALLASREVDEVPAVREGASHASHRIVLTEEKE